MEFGPTPMQRRVLAIDDDPISLAVAAVLLESEGCTVLQAESGERALDLLAASEPPDCVIADLRMPSLAGTDLAARLRRSAPRALLLAMSATPPAQVDGYDGVLRKPLSPEALRAVFTSLADRSPLAVSGADPAGSAQDRPDSAILDSAVFERLRGAMSKSAIEEVVSAFIEDSTARLAAMRSADPGAICRQAHTIKGSAAMLGAVQVAAVASAVEAGIDHHGDRQRKLDELELCVQRAEVMLKQRLKI